MKPKVFSKSGMGWMAFLFLYLTCVPGWAAEINLVTNGGFESPEAGSTYRVVSTGNSMAGWTVEQGTVETVSSSYWQTAEGNQSLDLNGIFEQIGTIYQDIATQPGQRYRIRFALAGNPEGGPKIKSLKLSWDGKELEELHFDTTGHTNISMGWEYHEYIVTACGDTSRLRFQSTSSSCCGPALDDISVTPLTQFESSSLPLVAPLQVEQPTSPRTVGVAIRDNVSTASSAPASAAVSATPIETEVAIQFYPCLTIKGNVGRTYRIESAETANATVWLTKTNLVLPSSPFIWIDTSGADASHRFYRAVMAP